MLRHFEGMCIEEVSRVLECQPGAAKHSVFRAVQKLRRSLEPASECSKMNHLTEEQLILHYYGEEGDALTAERHLDECQECREIYSSLQRVLNVVDSLPVPERGPEYGAEVWRRIAPAIPARRKWLASIRVVRMAMGGGRSRDGRSAGGGVLHGALLSARRAFPSSGDRHGGAPIRRSGNACCWWL